MRTKQVSITLWCVVGILVCVVLYPTQAGDKIDVLKYLYEQSDLVVVGKFTKEPGEPVSTPVLSDIITGLQVDDVLKGDDKLKGRIINVGIEHFHVVEEKIKNPLFKKDSRLIFFLKESRIDPVIRAMLRESLQEHQAQYPGEKLDFRVNLDGIIWKTVEPWFSVHFADPAMARTLKALSKKP